jgi:hypothetical protein
MEQIGIVANPGDDMLIPDLGQQRTTALFQQPVLPFGLIAGDIRRRQPFLARRSGRAILTIKAQWAAVQLALGAKRRPPNQLRRPALDAASNGGAQSDTNRSLP